MERDVFWTVNMLACATQHAIGWFWKQRQDRPHSMSLSSPHTQAPCLIFYPSPLKGERGSTNMGNEGEKRRLWLARERERAANTSWAVTTPNHASTCRWKRETERGPVPRRPSYTMRLQRHFYIMCPIERYGLLSYLFSHGWSAITVT